MDLYSDNWFKYLREDLVTEGLRDIGLPEYVIDYIEDAMPESPEKSKMLMGNLWKDSREYAAPLRELQFDVVNYMIEEFHDYVIASKLSDAGRPIDIDARTVEPFDINKGTNAPRMSYDDERIKQGERVKFVIQNVKNGVEKPFGTWRKMLMKAVKALSKAGIPSEKVESAKETFNTMLQSRFRVWWNRYDMISAFLNDDPTNYELAKDAMLNDGSGKFDVDELLMLAQSYLENKEDPENVLHEFDDGSYWYNLDTSNCPVEAERMGHCGSDHRGTLVSLRKKKKERRESSSYVTMTWGGDVLYQIKGRNNDAPPRETWDHIVWFINNYGIDEVEETGEYSNDYDGFENMNDYLRRNTNARIGMNIEEAMEQAQTAVREVEENFYQSRNENDWTSISCKVESGEEFGGDPRSIYLYMNGSVEFEIDLGWPGFTQADGDYVPTDADSTVELENLERIPINSYGRAAREFEDEMEGVQPEGADPNEYAPKTAHLKITISTSMTQDVDVGDPGDVRDYDSFADEMLKIDEAHDEIQEKIRRGLVQGGYMVKNAYDRAEADLAEMELANFKVYQDDSGIEFWFTPDIEGAESNMIKSDIQIPNFVKQYLRDSNKYYNQSIETLYPEIFGTHYHSSGMSSQTLNNRMANHIQSLYAKQAAPDPRQMKLDFGKDYLAGDAKLLLAKDSRFIIVPLVKYSYQQTGRYPEMGIGWKYTIGVNSKSPEGEVEIVKDIVEFLDKNPELIIQAANEIIQYSVEPAFDEAKKKRAKILDNQEYVEARENIKSRYSASADHDELSMRIMAILGWFEQNYAKMSEVQRFVMWKYFLAPMSQGNFRRYDAAAQLDVETGKPRNFEDYVYQQLMKLGATDNSARRGASINESVEDQIVRIDNLLNELDPSYDLRIYNIEIGCTIERHRGGSESETATEIRGIEGVTTVRPVAARKRNITPTAGCVLFDIKFELLGSQSRVDYRDKVLLPALRKIRGLKILTVSSIHRTNRKGTIRTVRESVINELGMGSAFGYGVDNVGGLAGNLGSVRRQQTRDMPTPRPQLQSILDDWVEGGVMAYDAPTNYTDMRYHVMMPVEELLPFITSEYRGDMKDFQGRYKHFISTGPQAPVYVAIGQNGRIKITGGEDLVWFAKKSGLEELPCFFSYQKQV
jgi:hypothetical protein